MIGMILNAGPIWKLIAASIAILFIYTAWECGDEYLTHHVKALNEELVRTALVKTVLSCIIGIPMAFAEPYKRFAQIISGRVKKHKIKREVLKDDE